ncbi:MAG TPA: hypothetical protein VK431_06015, partial [Nitrosopumilaceae archaeon]|nr:hypothetical protein [Nitrosopumilaceae archaeon]
MALEFRNKKLGLLVIMVLMASPYVYTESNSQIIPAAFADSSYALQTVGPNYPGTVGGGMWNNLNGVLGSSVGTCASVT